MTELAGTVVVLLYLVVVFWDIVLVAEAVVVIVFAEFEGMVVSVLVEEDEELDEAGP